MTAVTSTTASNLLSFTLSSPVAGGVLGLNYTPSGNGWMSNNGVQMGFSKWSIGDGSGNTIDRASETTARMVLMGNLGNDTLKGGAKSDLIVGGAGDDTLNGNAGNDLLAGGAGDDSLSGGDDNDTLRVESHADRTIGERGGHAIAIALQMDKTGR